MVGLNRGTLVLYSDVDTGRVKTGLFIGGNYGQITETTRAKGNPLAQGVH
jgi:hypothetical protein